MGSADLDRVSAVFREALSSFMSRRKSPLTAQMFTDLFNRFPVSGADGAEVHPGSLWPDLTRRLCHFQVLCVDMLDATVQHITSGVRIHQQVTIVHAGTVERGRIPDWRET